MLSLAAIRYRAILSVDGGPIESLEEGELDIFGRRYFQANARLVSGLVPDRKMQVYSNADGTGMHPSPMVARHMAVSEALERWAYHSVVHSSNRFDLGFDADPSSSGMAAFPGLGRSTARRAARNEAIERFCLLNWWERRIDGRLEKTKWEGVWAISLKPPSNGSAVILFMRSKLGFYAYGHAAAQSFSAACDKALTELIRHEWAIQLWKALENPGPPVNAFERRSLFFSSDEGHSLFLERISHKTNAPFPEMDVVCDTEIIGPWSTYTTVWRYLFRPPSHNFVSDEVGYFFW